MNQKLALRNDERGTLMEVFKIPNFGQVFYSTSVPGVIRGNHYHTRKKELFCVVEGRGKISMRDIVTGEKKEYIVSGDQPEIIEMPLNWTHNIQNIGDVDMKLIVWISEIFNPDDPDTFREEV